MNQIQFHRLINTGGVPTSAQVKEGALVLNLADRKVYTKDHNGTVIELGIYAQQNAFSFYKATGSQELRWYRIAKATGGPPATGTFSVRSTRSGQHTVVNFIASASYGRDPQITLLNSSNYGSTAIHQIRLEYQSTYDEYHVMVQCDGDNLSVKALNVEQFAESWVANDTADRSGVAINTNLFNKCIDTAGGDIYENGQRVYSPNNKPSPADLGAAAVSHNHNETSAATANRIALRDSAADLHCRLLRSNYANQSSFSGAIAFRVNNSSDNYTRYCSSPTSVRSWLSVYSQSETESRYLGKTAKAASAVTADSATNATNATNLGSTNLNKTGSAFITIPNAAWWGDKGVGHSQMVKSDSVGLPTTGAGYVFKVGARDIAQGSGWLYLDNYGTGGNLWIGGSYDKNSSPSWAKVYSTRNKPTADDVGCIARSGDQTFTGKLTASAGNRQSGVYGTYDSHKIDHIWSIGTSYKIASDGSSFGNLYGLAYKHTNNTTGGTMAGSHQVLWCQNGVPYAALGHNIWARNKVLASGADLTGDLTFTGSPTTSNQSRSIVFDAFDKEGTTDTTDKAYIRHTSNVGGHANSVLEIASLNDSGDGIAFTTHASSRLRHNGNAIYTEGNKPSHSDVGALQRVESSGHLIVPESRWFRAATTGTGFLPNSNGQSYLGTSSWRFREAHINTIYESGKTLGSKYSKYINCGGLSDYSKGVLLLFMLDNADISAYRAFQGTVTMERVNGLYEPYRYEISAMKAYNNDAPYGTYYTVGNSSNANNYLVTCTYNGKKWLGIRVAHNDAQVAYVRCYGWWGVDPVLIKYETVRDGNTTVNNEEIRNSIAKYRDFDAFYGTRYQPDSRYWHKDASLYFGSSKNKGLYWGGHYEDDAGHDGTWAYIRGNQGTLELGSDDPINIYETDTRTLAVQISTNARTLDAKGGLKENGTSLVDKYLGKTAKASSASSADRLPIHDTRGANRAPNYYNRRAVRFDFVEQSQLGVGGDTWTAIQTVSPWSSYSSAHRPQQLAFKGSGGLSFRYATSDTAWSGWQTVYSTINKPSKADVGLSNVNNWGATSSVSSTSTSTYATASAVRSAYNLAASKMTQSTGDGRYLGITAVAAKSKSEFHPYHGGGTLDLNTIQPTNNGFSYIGNLGSSSPNLFPRGNNASGVLTFSTHSGSYKAQLGFSSNGNLYHRSTQGGSSYSGWETVYTSGTKPSKADVGLGSVNNWGASTSVSSTSTTTYATSSAVKAAYDRGTSALNTANGKMSDGGTYGTLYLTNWIRPKGDTGVYFQDHGGGWHMTDTTWVRVYGGKQVYVSSTSSESIKTAGGIYAGGNITAYSDVRLKTNIQPISNALDKVKQLSGNVYDRVDTESPLRQAGVIAQEVQAVLPEAVVEDGEGKLGVNYNGVVALLLQAVKELQEEVASLKLQINS